MKFRSLAPAAGVLAVTGTIASAGGLDRTGQPIGVLFEEGRRLELSFGYVVPDVSGTDLAMTPTGDVGESYFLPSVAYKADFNENISYALIVDRPSGAKVEYGATSILYAGTTASASSTAITALGRYKFNDRLSIHGGVRAQQIQAEVGLSGAAYGLVSGYEFDTDADWGFGYVVGAAYEIPDIALRVALTYSSEIDHDLDTTENLFGTSTTRVTAPQSVNLDFQTGIAADTLLFGSVRWVNWDGFNVTPSGLFGATGSSLVEYEENTITYNLGVGRRFSERWSAAVSVGFEAGNADTVSALGPTDGFLSVGAGATYTMQNGTEITGGLRYILPGDATVASGGGTAEFENNSAIGAGLQIAFKF